MLNSIQKHPLLTEFGLVTAAAVGAYELDHHLGDHDNVTRRASPEFYVNHPDDAWQTLGVLPGCQIDSKRYFDSLLSFTTDTHLVVTAYPEHSFDVEQVCEGLANNLLRSRIERPSLLCQSMGGIVMRHFLDYCQTQGVTEKLGGFGSIVMDSSPFDGQDIHRQSRLLLKAAGFARSSKVLDKAKRVSMLAWDKSNMSAGAHLDTIYAEGKFIDDTHPTNALPDIMDSVYYVHGSNDFVINTDQASRKYEHISPAGKFYDILDSSRPERSHTASMPQYRFQLDLAKVSTQEIYAAA
jgi:hypothetical protein